ncbi:MAG: PilZ domain-containing protein [Treponema sp.]|jgi:hypothetical protein|nr:PilZ domain-containing protein [Treponema sp.]
MATPIKRIEKDFLLKVLYDDQLPVVYLNDRTEYILRLEKPTKNEVFFKCEKPIPDLRVKKKLDLMFEFMGRVVLFSIVIKSVRDTHIVADVPELLFKDLDRSYSRVNSPEDMKVQFTFRGDRFNLRYPRIQEFEPANMGRWLKDADPKNLQGLIDQMGEWAQGFSDGYKIVIFKEIKPSSTEERILAETGKALYLPSTLGGFPQTDPYPKKRIITGEIFRRYLESTGVNPLYLDDSVNRFVRQKFERGFLSDAWIPILFQEYVIGYIHIWINKGGKAPFDYKLVEALYEFAKVLAFSLKLNGYFDSGRIKNKPFTGKIVDISASGLLFACPHSDFSAVLLPDSELAVRLFAPRRAIKATVRIVRRYKDSAMGYFGSRFLDMDPGDTRFLFEFLYGKPFSDADALFVMGQV